MRQTTFFADINDCINEHAEEVTVVGSRIEENLFNSKTVPQEYLFNFIDAMGALFSEGVDVNKLQQFSFQLADNITYVEHKFMAVYSGGRQDCSSFNVSIKNPHDDYCVNYFVDSKVRHAKFYDKDVWKYKQPAVPPGCQLLTHWGQGVNSAISGIHDLYLLYHSPQDIADFYCLPRPHHHSIRDFCNDTDVMKVFGLTYRTSDFKPLKLKMYYYPNDPHMQFTVFDEVCNT